MECKFYENTAVPFLIEKNGIVHNVNDMFIKLTKFPETELAAKSVSTVWHNLLHINTDFDFVNSDLEVILFTKFLEARFVTISKVEDSIKNETIYKFIEKPDSRLENKLLFIEKLISDEKLGIGIYTAENFALLKANQRYLDYLPKPFNKKESSYGKYLEEILPNFKNSNGEKAFRKIVETNESLYITEMQGLIPAYVDKYWDNTITPIVEDGKVKYIVSMLQDVTDRVLSRNLIKIKNQQLEAIFNSTEDIIFVLDKYAEYVSGNKTSKEVFTLFKENLKLPQKCFKAYDSSGKELNSNEFNFEVVLTGKEIEKVLLTIELNDNIKYFKLNGKPIFNKNNEVLSAIFVLHDTTEEINRIKIIEQQNRELEAIINNSYNCICVVDKNGNYIRKNKTLKKVLKDIMNYNLPVKNVGDTMKNHQKYYTEEHEEIPLEKFPSYRVLKGEKFNGQRVIIETENGRKHLDFDGIPVYDENNEFEIGILIAKDMTEYINNNMEIERQNKQLAAVIECIGDIISLVDKDGNFVHQSKILNDILGSGHKNFYRIGNNIQFYDFNGEIIKKEELCTCRLLNGERVKDYRSKIVKDGKETYISANGIPIFDENRNLEMGVLVTHDITKLMQYYKKIEAQKKDLDTIIENMSDGLVVIDKDGNIIKKNKAIVGINGDPSNINQEITNVAETLSSRREYYDDFGNKLSLDDLPISKILKGEPVHNQRIMSKKGAAKTYAEFNCTPIFDDNGNLQYAILLRHDMTDIMEKENKIKKQQKLLYMSEKNQREILEKALIMKDEFISMITHEFKTPLNVIYSAIQLIECVYIKQLNDRMKDLIGNIKQNTYRQLRLVNNLLDITRLNSDRLSLNMKNIDIIFLTEMIVESVKLYSNQKDIKLSFKTDIDSKTFAIDDEKYERILLNILSNAIKFTPNGGRITVDVKENKLNNSISISITDSGIGIPKEKQKLIFERFGQVESTLSRQAEGTGIGLSLVKLLVDLLNGSITVESELGVGSTFEIMLPIKECVEDKQDNLLLDADTRLITSINVEFSDIYL